MSATLLSECKRARVAISDRSSRCYAPVAFRSGRVASSRSSTIRPGWRNLGPCVIGTSGQNLLRWTLPFSLAPFFLWPELFERVSRNFLFRSVAIRITVRERVQSLDSRRRETESKWEEYGSHRNCFVTKASRLANPSTHFSSGLANKQLK